MGTTQSAQIDQIFKLDTSNDNFRLTSKHLEYILSLADSPDLCYKYNFTAERTKKLFEKSPHFFKNIFLRCLEYIESAILQIKFNAGAPSAKDVLKAIRILTRFIEFSHKNESLKPFLFEINQNNDKNDQNSTNNENKNENKIEKNGENNQNNSKIDGNHIENNQNSQNIENTEKIENNSENDENNSKNDENKDKNAKKGENNGGKNRKAKISVASRILNAFTTLLFSDEICVPFQGENSKKGGNMLWAPRGNNDWASKGFESNYFFDLNRAEILKALIVCFSRNIFFLQPKQPLKINDFVNIEYPNAWIDLFLDVKKHPNSETLFYSLLNTICSYRLLNKQYFNYAFKQLLFASFHLILIILFYRKYSLIEFELIFKTDYFFVNSKNSEVDQKANFFIDCVKEKSFSIFYGEILSTLEEVFTNLKKSELFYGENFDTESLLLFWVLLEHCDEFVDYFLDNGTKAIFGMVNLLNVVNLKRVPTGILNMILAIILRLTKNRKFLVAMNSIYSQKQHKIFGLKNFDNFSLGEIIINLIRQLFEKTKYFSQFISDKLIFQVGLSIICNISSFLININLSSSVCLMSMTERFLTMYKQNMYGDKKLILRHFVSMAVEILSNIIQHQHFGGCHLIYAIVHKRNIFEKLTILGEEKKINISKGASDKKVVLAKFKIALLKRFLAKINAKNKEILPKNGAENNNGENDKKLAKINVKNGKNDENLAKNCFENDKNDEILTNFDLILLKKYQNEEKSFRASNGVKNILIQNFETEINERKFWKNNKSLKTILKLNRHLSPLLNQFCDQQENISQEKVLQFIRQTVLVDVLPLPNQIVLKEYKSSINMENWIIRLLWKVILMNGIYDNFFEMNSLKMFELVKFE